MGHPQGFPCLHTDPNHEGRCSTPIIGVDLGRTRWFEVTETQGPGKSYWRTNGTARRGAQVEFLRPSGWRTSVVFDTESAFLKSVARFEWREIGPDDVPPVGSGGDGEQS